MQEVPISNLPNTHFAHFGKVQGSVEVFVIFPRIMHRHPLQRGSETKIPLEVEIFWLWKLIYPTLNMLKAAGVKPYTNINYKDILFKHRGVQRTQYLKCQMIDKRHHFSPLSAFIVCSPHFLKICLLPSLEDPPLSIL